MAVDAKQVHHGLLDQTAQAQQVACLDLRYGRRECGGGRPFIAAYGRLHQRWNVFVGHVCHIGLSHAIPCTSLVELDGPHLLPLENPQEFGAALRSFLGP